MSRPEIKRKVRCAVYTRKSSEEGLESSFNSLDAQREACAAYIDSQRHEGWLALDDRYDDGGYSGGTLERPALQRLIRDIEAGSVDTVVCYKIDRLSRSLTDFAKLVDVFERNSVTFVSVTQSFCTTTSMGLELDTLTIRIPMRLQRRGGRKLIMTPEGAAVPTPKPRRDETLVRALVRAHRWRRRIESGCAKSITDLAEQEGVTDAYVCRLLPLTCLAPDIVEAILDGRQPKGLRLAEMLGNGPLGWQEQRRAWGFSRNSGSC